MGKNLKGILENLIYLVLIIVLFAIGSMLLTDQLTQAKTRFNISPFSITIISIVFFGGIGVVLGLISRDQSVGKVTQVDKSRLLLITLPAFIVSMSYVWAYFGMFTDSIYQYILGNDYVVIVASIILGFSILSIFRRKN